MRSIRSRLRVRLAKQLRGRILDCGSGDLFGPFLRRGGNEVISLDLDEAALAKTPGTRVVSSCARMPFVNDYFDAVWACAIIEHVKEEVLPEMVRVTRPGGRMVAVTPNRHSPFDCLKRLIGLDAWDQIEGHVRLYGLQELALYGEVHGEARFVPWMGWFFRSHPQVAHVWIIDIRVTQALKRELAARFGALLDAPRPTVARVLL